MKHIQINNFHISNDLPIVLIAGPCQVESMNHSLSMAKEISSIAQELKIQFIYKSSFDKANRTSVFGKRGVGLEQSCEIFQAIKQEIGCPILTDIHEPWQAEMIAPYADVLQIPALLCRQTDLILAAARTGKCVNVKKGQFLAPSDMKNAIEKCESAHNTNVMITERGTSFGYNTLINDMRGLQIMKHMNYPVIFDATHSVQQPGALSNASGGERQFIEVLSRSSVAAGIAGIFIETHDNPNDAPSDGKCMLPLKNLKELLVRVQKIDKITKEFPYINID